MNTLNIKRYVLYFLLAFVTFQLWNAWEKEHPNVVTPNTQTNNANIPNNAIPTTGDASNPAPTATTSGTGNTPFVPVANTNNTPQTASIPADRLITVETDVLRVQIDKLGGNVVSTKLIKYPDTLEQPNIPVTLLNYDPASYYSSVSSLLGQLGPDTSKGFATYTASKQSYTLSPDQQTLNVDLQWQNPEGIQVTKHFTFKRGDYTISLDYFLKNDSPAAWSGHFYTQLSRRSVEPVQKGLFHTMTYLGAAMSSPQQLFEKITFANMDKENLNRQINGGWVAMLQHYFLTAWIPGTFAANANNNQPIPPNNFYSNVNNGVYTIGILGPLVTINAGGQQIFHATLYSGPEVTSVLKKIAPGLDQTVDYGILWIISAAIFWLMQKIFDFVGNWGWSIVLVTLCIKLVFYKLSETSYRSMAKMRNLQPRVESLKERCGSDKQKFSQQLMELYRKEKVNPLSGCLPILIQIPVFLALYWVLIESVELRQAPFMFWIHDLSAKDPFYVLPILMGLSMLVQQKLSPAPPDPMQAKMMMALPFVFTILFATFPSGLVLYWFVNNAISIAQQWFITTRMEKALKQKKIK